MGSFVRLLNGVAVGAGGFPLVSLVPTVSFTDDGDLIADHKGGVKANAELTDDVDVLLLVVFLLELKRAALGDGAQIVFQLFLGHTAAVVGNRQGSRLFVDGKPDGKVVPIKAAQVLAEGVVVQFVDGVAGVGDQFPEENFLVGVDGINHHIQQTLGFRFEFFLSHDFLHLY